MKICSLPDAFVAPPHFEALGVILGIPASIQHGRGSYRVLSPDVERAHPFAIATGPIDFHRNSQGRLRAERRLPRWKA